MFIGHFGVGFGSKKIIPKPSLGTLFLAAQFVDLIWPFLLLLGWERVEIDPGNTVVAPLNFVHYPISHSLLGAVLWALFFGIVYFLIKKNLKVSIWLGALVISHWILDFFTHRPDLQIVPWSSKVVGLGLWNSLAGTIIVEVLIFAIGIYFYSKATKPKNKIGIYSLWSLVIFLILIYFSNLFGPPPASAGAIGYVGLAQWILVGWGYWIDKNREAKKFVV